MNWKFSDLFKFKSRREQSHNIKAERVKIVNIHGDTNELIDKAFKEFKASIKSALDVQQQQIDDLKVEVNHVHSILNHFNLYIIKESPDGRRKDSKTGTE